MSLTANFLHKPMLREKRYLVFDDPTARSGVKGLALRVSPSGHCGWYIKYRDADGKQILHNLGPARDADGRVRLGLASARAKAKDAFRRVAQDEDLPETKRGVRTPANTLNAVLDEYNALVLKSKRTAGLPTSASS